MSRKASPADAGEPLSVPRLRRGFNLQPDGVSCKVARRLVEAHRGSIRATNTGPVQGVTICRHPAGPR